MSNNIYYIHNSNGSTSIIPDLNTWCKENHHNFVSLLNRIKENKNYKGLKITRVPINANQKLSNFMAKARGVHGNKYDYSKVKYVSATGKITIICPIHGEFQQSPSDHLSRRGCSKCGRLNQIQKRSMSLDQFIEKANKVHKCKYDYSKVKYVNTKTNVVIICPKHGEFLQTPDNHLAGHGCSICSGKKMNNDEFIRKAKEVHGNTYDYSKTVFVSSHKSVTIICPKHGEFLQTPTNHLNTPGCPECSYDKLRLGYDGFVKKARKIHGDQYSYPKFDYSKIGFKITIVCPKHGPFQQQIKNHLAGQGCPKCGIEKIIGSDYSKSKDKGILYILKCRLGEDIFCKVGITKHSLKHRFASAKFEILESIIFDGKISKHFNNEQIILKQFKPYKFHSKQKFSGYTECFKIEAYPKISSLLSKKYPV